MPELRITTSLGALRGQWDALVLRHRPPSPFLRSWWIEGVGTPRARLLLVTEGERLLGGVALEAAREFGVPVLRNLGSELGAIHMDVVADPAHERLVVDAVRNWIRANGSGLLDLDGLRADARLTHALRGYGNALPVAGAPTIRLPASYDDYLAGLPAKMRSNIRRHERRLAGDGFVHRRLPPDETEHGLRHLHRLHGRLFGDESLFLPHFPRFARAARAGVAAGELAFHVLARGAQVIAADVTFELPGYGHLYQVGRDPDDRRYRGAGVALLAGVLRHACRDGLGELDLGRGDFDYKRDWAAEVRVVERFEGARGHAPRSLHRAVGLKRRVHAALRRSRSR